MQGRCGWALTRLFSGSSRGTRRRWPRRTRKQRGSDNIEVVAHVPLGGPGSVSGIEIEQDLSRPFVDVGREARYSGFERDMDVIDIGDPERPRVIHRWRIERQELHLGLGGRDLKDFEWNGGHSVVLSVEFGQGGRNADLGAAIFDVTGLPDQLREVARIGEREPSTLARNTAARLPHGHQRSRFGTYLHSIARRSLRHRRCGVPVCAATRLGSAAGPRQRSGQHQPTDLRLDGQLGTPWCRTARSAGRTSSCQATGMAFRSSPYRSRTPEDDRSL